MIQITIPPDDICVLAKQPDITAIPKDMPGIYRFYDKNGQVVYIGKTACLYHRVQQHISGTAVNTIDINHNFYIVKCFYVACPAERDIYETYLINTLKPILNTDKVFTYKSQRFNPIYRKQQFLREEDRSKEEIWQSICNKMRNRKPIGV